MELTANPHYSGGS